MPGGQYTSEEHKEAFEIYYETRTWAAVCRKLNITVPTVMSWSKKDFQCRFGCPYHGWMELIEERRNGIDRTIAASQTLKRDLTPVEIERIASSDTKTRRTDRKELISRIVRSDFERITHWEILYSKVLYDLTGLVADVPGIDMAQVLNRMDTRELMRSGLHFTNGDVAVKALAYIQEQIMNLRGNISPANDIEEDQEQIFTLDELNRIRLQTVSKPALAAPSETINFNNAVPETETESATGD